MDHDVYPMMGAVWGAVGFYFVQQNLVFLSFQYLRLFAQPICFIYIYIYMRVYHKNIFCVIYKNGSNAHRELVVKNLHVCVCWLLMCYHDKNTKFLHYILAVSKLTK